MLFLRRQLALYVERGVKPRRIDAATRVSLALLSRLAPSRFQALLEGQVSPGTVADSAENPLWGQERIANELST